MSLRTIRIICPGRYGVLITIALTKVVDKGLSYSDGIRINGLMSWFNTNSYIRHNNVGVKLVHMNNCYQWLL